MSQNAWMTDVLSKPYAYPHTTTASQSDSQTNVPFLKSQRNFVLPSTCRSLKITKKKKKKKKKKMIQIDNKNY